MKEMNYKLTVIWEHQKQIEIMQKMFKMAEEINIDVEDIQWLYQIPITILKTKHIYNFSEFFIDETRCIWYNCFNISSKNIILYFHGGGYCIGSPEVYYDFLARIKKDLNDKNINILFIDYKKSPKYKYPISIDNTYYTYFYISSLFKNKNFIFMGDSAGANLSLQVCQKAIENKIKLPKTIICLSPWIITNIRNKYWKENNDKDYLTPFSVDLAIESYLGYNNLKKRWDKCVLDFNYDLFPNMMIRAGSHELILDEILAFKNKVEKSKCNLIFELIPKCVHSFDFFYSFTNQYPPKHDNLINYINKNLEE